MHKLIEAACRRSAGIAAGVILTGGLAGGVLLTPGTAYAATPVATTTAITSTSQTPTFHGTTLTVNVSVTPANTTNGTPGGTVQVTGAGGGCSATLNSSGAGSCSIFDVPFGSYTLTASYAANALFNASSGTAAVKVGPVLTAPVFTADSPSLAARGGDFYSYTFHAVGSPGIRYSVSGPSWLQINPFTGTVSGTVPFYGGSFSYSVTATNGVGSATAGPYRVYVNNYRHFGSNINTYLTCTSRVYTDQRGSCTLWVTNRGYGAAPGVTAQIALPSQLQADHCGAFSYGFFNGCVLSGNTAVEDLGTLNPGQTRQLTVVFTAKTGFGLWGRHHGFRFTVKVVGSAYSFGSFPYFQRGASYSSAYVTIIPRGWWAY
jgi:hypothetical protein